MVVLWDLFLGALDQRHVIASGPETLMPRCLENKKNAPLKRERSVCLSDEKQRFSASHTRESLMLTRVTREIQTLPHFNHFICTSGGRPRPESSARANIITFLYRACQAAAACTQLRWKFNIGHWLWAIEGKKNVTTCFYCCQTRWSRVKSSIFGPGLVGQ